jgi:hypothetical protein
MKQFIQGAKTSQLNYKEKQLNNLVCPSLSHSLRRARQERPLATPGLNNELTALSLGLRRGCQLLARR